MLSIADRDRRIDRLKRLLSIEKTARKSLVAQRENKRRHQDPAYRERFRLARRAHDIATGRALPDMSAEQRTLYNNAKTHYRMTRAEALAVVFAKPSVRPSSLPERMVSATPRPAGRHDNSSPVVAPISLERVT